MVETLQKRWRMRRRKRRLKRILKALKLGFELLPWQEDLILKEKPDMFPQGVRWKRRTGKTLAVILRSLVWDPPLPLGVMDCLKMDPDTWDNKTVTCWTWREYARYASACRNAGIRLRCNDLTDAGMRRALIAEDARRKKSTIIYGSNCHG